MHSVLVVALISLRGAFWIGLAANPLLTLAQTSSPVAKEKPLGPEAYGKTEVYPFVLSSGAGAAFRYDSEANVYSCPDLSYRRVAKTDVRDVEVVVRFKATGAQGGAAINVRSDKIALPGELGTLRPAEWCRNFQEAFCLYTLSGEGEAQVALLDHGMLSEEMGDPKERPDSAQAAGKRTSPGAKPPNMTLEQARLSPWLSVPLRFPKTGSLIPCFPFPNPTDRN